MMRKFLFNFAVSYTGGGYKRLYEYLKWFNENGGAYFIINSKVEHLSKEFINNKYYFVKQSLFERILTDGSYLDAIVKDNGIFDLFYSYGVPMSRKIGKVNWFHLSNVLPLVPNKIKMSFYNRLRFRFIGYKTKQGFNNSDIISAESEYSFSLINTKYKSKFFLSKNGGDDEITFLRNYTPMEKDKMALVIGTHWYKMIDDSYAIFKMLQKDDRSLKLVIIGNDKTISQSVKDDKNVVIINRFLDRASIVEYLSKCKYYISTTLIENSYNAISEGIGFADESFVSDIGPHSEFLRDTKKQKISIPNCTCTVFHVHRQDVNLSILQTWESIINEMIAKTDDLLNH